MDYRLTDEEIAQKLNMEECGFPCPFCLEYPECDQCREIRKVADAAFREGV